MRSDDLKDWVIVTQLARDCCESAQSNGADEAAQAVLRALGDILRAALDEDSRFLVLATVGLGAPVRIAPGTVAAFSFRTLPAVFPPWMVGATLLAVGVEFGNVYGRTAVLNALSDAVTVTQACLQAVQTRIRTRTKTRKSIFDCDKCVRQKTLPQHGSRVPVPR